MICSVHAHTHAGGWWGVLVLWRTIREKLGAIMVYYEEQDSILELEMCTGSNSSGNRCGAMEARCLYPGFACYCCT